MLNIRLITPPVVEPVSLEDMKSFLVVDAGFTDDDSVISGLISAARGYAEQFMNRAIFEQSYLLNRDYFPLWMPNQSSRHSALEALLGIDVMRQQCIYLPWPGLVSVTSIKYTDTSGTVQTLDESSYLVDTSSEPGRISPLPTQTWPTAEFYQPGSVQITFVSGTWGDGIEVNTCPQSITTAIQLLVSSWYNSRAGTSAVNMSVIPFGVDVLLNQYRFGGWGF